MKINRNHPLTLGEIVFDCDANLFGVITKLNKSKATLSMCASASDSKYTPSNLPIGWCEYENKKMFDSEIKEDELTWQTNDLDMLYQIAWGIKDKRTENLVCYEHIMMDDEYPYYSPYLEENLFNFEVEEC